MAKPIASWESFKVDAVRNPPWPWSKFQQKKIEGISPPEKRKKNQKFTFQKNPLGSGGQPPPENPMHIVEILDAWNRLENHLDFNEPRGRGDITPPPFFPPKLNQLLRFAKPTWGEKWQPSGPSKGGLVTTHLKEIQSNWIIIPQVGGKYQKKIC